MDYDNDGDNDLLVICPDKPCNCTYFFENPDGNVKMPVFLPPVKVGKAYENVQPSYINGKVRLLSANLEIVNYKENKFEKTVKIYNEAFIHIPDNLKIKPKLSRIRANQ